MYRKRQIKARAWFDQFNNGTKYSTIQAKGVDCRKVVGFRTLKPGKRVGQWVYPNGKPGKWFTEPGTDPKTLGIDLKGRVYKEGMVNKPIRVMRSRAADLKNGVAPGVGGKGGGPQITMPPGWESKITWIGG